MNIAKRRRLKAKRTPWAKTRSGRRAHARANVMRAMVLARGMANINAIRFSQNGCGKKLAIANAAVDTYQAAAKVPVYGAKTA